MPPRKSKETASWWHWPFNVLLGVVAGHFWAIKHIANLDGRIEQSFSLTVGIAIVGGLGMAIFTARLHKSALTAFCVGIIAFGVSALLWH